MMEKGALLNFGVSQVETNSRRKGHGDIATFQKMAVNQSVKTKWNREYKTPFSH